jgi:hypothetical protein
MPKAVMGTRADGNYENTTGEYISYLGRQLVS